MIATVVAIGLILTGTAIVLAFVEFFEAGTYTRPETNTRLLREVRRQPHQNYQFDRVRIIPKDKQ